jgi:hypothetical protein
LTAEVTNITSVPAYAAADNNVSNRVIRHVTSCFDVRVSVPLNPDAKIHFRNHSTRVNWSLILDSFSLESTAVKTGFSVCMLRFMQNEFITIRSHLL